MAHSQAGRDFELARQTASRGGTRRKECEGPEPSVPLFQCQRFRIRVEEAAGCDARWPCETRRAQQRGVEGWCRPGTRAGPWRRPARSADLRGTGVRWRTRAASPCPALTRAGSLSHRPVSAHHRGLPWCRRPRWSRQWPPPRLGQRRRGRHSCCPCAIGG
ncbi:hypothetical protein FA10DRAFT_201271 [Acaromyces ingoldii]|uniref:Uncharacterized protein n=1 Tax=Acaromyces ingoldii TaxID=215250 RepID=A0A316YC86_9BASI|nr:hypothetical protein FA10DRAFT_201271 [Acaromyces ingoldii]PWN86849.1 hypothetical protein FA10DRAFT_201271 [Acaromyces ingoldii]